MSLDAASLLLVSADATLRTTAAALRVRVEAVPTAALALRALADDMFDIVLLDLVIADVAPRDFVATLAHRYPGMPVVLAAEPARVPEAVELVRRGADDFVRKPVHGEELAFTLEKLLTALSSDDVPPPSLRAGPSVVGRSPAMLALLALVDRAARSNATVLVRGETGSGKEVVARRVHELSARARGPFLKVHCAALPEHLLESELFGYEKGAFTGAQSRKPGRVELAQGGTLFLDEIGDVTAATQVKLLRILQDRKYERLGGSETLDADVRFVTATHRNLERMVADGTFREDLYYRINVIPITVPPLREHASDIPDLVRHFVAATADENGKKQVGVAPAAMDLLSRYAFPGNVRQLQNLVERLVVLSDSPSVEPEAVRAELGRLTAAAPRPAEPSPPASTFEESAVLLDDAVRKAERRVLEKALKNADGNRTVAARILGISRRTLYYKLHEHGLGG